MLACSSFTSEKDLPLSSRSVLDRFGWCRLGDGLRALRAPTKNPGRKEGSQPAVGAVRLSSASRMPQLSKSPIRAAAYKRAAVASERQGSF